MTLPVETGVVEALRELLRDCLANDFNEHWESYAEASAALARYETSLGSRPAAPSVPTEQGDGAVVEWRPQADAPNGCWALVRFQSGEIGVACKTLNEPPFLQDWRWGISGERGTQAGWPMDYVPLADVLALIARQQAAPLDDLSGGDEGSSSPKGEDTQRAAETAVVAHMVDRFLGWRLPEGFNPDNGIGFDKTDLHPQHWPIGTNLLDASQAEAMVRHLLDGLPAPGRESIARIIAPSAFAEIRSRTDGSPTGGLKYADRQANRNKALKKAAQILRLFSSTGGGA